MDTRMSGANPTLRVARENVPGTVRQGGGSLNECLRYGNNCSINDQSHVQLEEIKEHLWRGKFLSSRELPPERYADCECPRWGWSCDPRRFAWPII